MARLVSSLLLVVLAFSSVSAQTAAPTAASLGAANDANVLNYALTLENLEAAFYNAALGTTTAPGPITAASFPIATYPANTFSYIQMIQAHENSHVQFLNGVLGSAAVQPCTYNWSNAFATTASFLATAAALENGGQTAYDGAINGLTNAGTAQVAATIATVEARHAAFLNELQSPLYTTSPFPNGFDQTNSPAAVVALVSGFITSCPYNVSAILPSVRPSGVALTNGNVVKTGSPLLSTSYTTAQQQNDIDVLNYALTLENLEAAFYNYINATFSAANFTTAGFPSYYYNYTQMITTHENLHVQVLTATINGRKANTAVPACVYNFTSIKSLTGAGGYLNWAFILENTGVMAYDGAAGLITDTTLQQIAASIATVEARHAAFLNQAFNGTALGAGVPFPAPYDTGMNSTQIIAAVLATGLVVSCPYTIPQPVAIASQAQYVGTAAVSSSSSSSSSTGYNGAAADKVPSLVLQAALVLAFVLASVSL